MKLSRRQFLWGALCATAAVSVGACAPANREPQPQPPEIAYGQDMCEGCGMLISDPRFACASVMKAGAAHKFDDIGDMLIFHLDRPNLEVAAYFVHDYSSQSWQRAESIFYVLAPGLVSPMGHGIAAFVQAADAKAFAAERHVSALHFDELRLQVHERFHQ